MVFFHDTFKKLYRVFNLILFLQIGYSVVISILQNEMQELLWKMETKKVQSPLFYLVVWQLIQECIQHANSNIVI